MRHPRYRWSLLLLPIVLAGCSSTVASRFGGTSQSRSIAVVGDRTLPASTGEPGGQVVADVTEPEPRRNPKTRISGRVVDDQGEPVSNVTVRLADGVVKGGRDIRGTTDRSGAFTLNGLRPGTTYSLIAEAEDDRGPLTGRVQAKTSETGVEISLVSEEAGSKSASRRPTRPSRVKPISNREEASEDPSLDEGPRVNREDISKPAEDAETLDPGPSPASGSSRPQLSAPQPAVGWKNTNASKPASPKSRGPQNVATSSEDPPTRRARVAPADASSSEEDGPNPLPPAIDPENSASPEAPRTSPRGKVGAKAPATKPESAEIAQAPEANVRSEVASELLKMPPLGPNLDSLPPSKPSSIVVASGGPKAMPQPAPPPTLSEPPTMPPLGSDPVASLSPTVPTTSPPEMMPVPQSAASTNPASQPVFASQAPTTTPSAPAEYNPFVLAASTPAVADRAVAPSRTDPKPAPERPAPSDEGWESAPPAAEAPKKKWGELAAIERPPVVVEPTKATVTNSFLKRFRPTVENRNPSVAQCSYDARLQKLNDFALPDLEGKPVRFQDLDADYVLLDFWGTWCTPCLDSIPHLIELQKKYGPNRLKVVGIACENVAPEKRKAKVEDFARKMGINYAVVLSTMDGKPCPVQQALQIQAYPTMILLDRKGQIVWRSTGATPANEYRLDRVLASSIGRLDRGTTVRR